MSPNSRVEIPRVCLGKILHEYHQSIHQEETSMGKTLDCLIIALGIFMEAEQEAKNCTLC